MADTVAAERLGTALRRVGYSEDAIHRLLGEEAYSSERTDTPGRKNAASPTPRLVMLARLLFLQLPVSARDAEAALGREGVEALEATRASAGRRPGRSARPHPADREGALSPRTGSLCDGDDPSDYVATYTPTARVLDCTDAAARGRARARRRHRQRRPRAPRRAPRKQVIATDVNPRALAYTELNAALNGSATSNAARAASSSRSRARGST